MDTSENDQSGSLISLNEIGNAESMDVSDTNEHIPLNAVTALCTEVSNDNNSIHSSIEKVIDSGRNQIHNSTIEGTSFDNVNVQNKYDCPIDNNLRTESQSYSVNSNTRLGAQPRGTKTTEKSKVGLTGILKEMLIHRKHHLINIHMALLFGVYDNCNSYLKLKPSKCSR